jgi:hypothetical protein
MAEKKILVNRDMNKNEILNVKAQNLAATPNDVVESQFWYDTANHTMKFYNGTNAVDMGSQGRIYTGGTGIDIDGSVISINIDVVARKSDLPTKVSDLTNDSGYISGITGSDVTTALGYTPYNATNPNGYQANVIETVKVNNTALTPSGKAVNVTVPTTAADVNALPNTTKYGANVDLSLNTTDYKMTITLKDQDGNTLGTAKTVDFPIESVVVGGSYDATNKNVVLELKNGNTIEFSVADLVSGLQSEITSTNKLNADLVDDSTSANKFVTAANKTTWNNKQDAISDLATIRSGAAKGATATQKITATNPALTATGGVCTWTISNTLATADVHVTIKEVATNDEVETSITTTANNVVIKMNSTSNIAAGTYKAVIIG